MNDIFRWQTMLRDLTEARLKAQTEFKKYGTVTQQTNNELLEKSAILKTALVIEDMKTGKFIK